ncbi:MAG: hypothetical protein P1V97_15820 [Planctomycetota bacterium]|nr:hypothetical protein [Planctomycetota bacterium]
MSGRIDRIPIESALSQCRTLFLVQLATPSRRVETITENLDAEKPFRYDLDVERYVYLDEWTHDKLPTSVNSSDKSPKLQAGDTIEAATVMDFMRLHVSRRYYNEGVRKIPIYDCLDVPEINDNKQQRLLFVTNFQANRGLFKVLGAAPLSLLDRSQFQSKN